MKKKTKPRYITIIKSNSLLHNHELNRKTTEYKVIHRHLTSSFTMDDVFIDNFSFCPKIPFRDDFWNTANM